VISGVTLASLEDGRGNSPPGRIPGTGRPTELLWQLPAAAGVRAGLRREELAVVAAEKEGEAASRQLSAEWAWNSGVWPPGEEEGIVDELNVQGDSGS
jgi:hypothetical protein